MRKIKRAARAVYRAIKRVFMLPIVIYQRKFSKHTCLYEPTCSEYTKRCINNKGVILGLILGIWRIIRCNPLSKGGYDPAPERNSVKWVF